MCWTKINTDWIPYIKRAYEDCKDFYNIAKYPQLYNNETNPQYHITFNNDQSFIAIDKMVDNNQLKVCIPENCRRSINENIVELRNLILESAHETLAYRTGKKPINTLKTTTFGQRCVRTQLTITNSVTPVNILCFRRKYPMD